MNAPAALAYLNATDVEADRAGWKRSLSVAPNPMRAETTIRYSLPQAAAVVVTVVDAQGRRVRTVQRGAEPAGPRELVWDGRDDTGHAVPNGVYFVQLESPTARGAGRIRTKTVVLR